MFAATTQQTVALVVFIAAFIGWAAFLIATNKKAKAEIGSELELAPNRKPYLDDEQLEGPHLERILLWGVLSLMVIGVGLPLYWITEPGRQKGAIVDFDERLAGKTYIHGQPIGGGALFSATAEGGFNCAGCHGGDKGLGDPVGVAYTLNDPVSGKPRQVRWKVPALDTAVLRYTDAQLTDILVYGRPFSPMPAWGLEGGGPMNDQQISNLVRYLHKLADDAAKSGFDAQQASAEAAAAELERLKTLDSQLTEAQDALDANTDEAMQSELEAAVAWLEDEIALEQPSSEGAALFNVNCARCHTLGWSYGEPQAPGGGAYGPPLYNVENQFPDAADQVDFVTLGRKRGEKYGVNGQSSGRMPRFGQLLTEDQIDAIVRYERTLREPS